MDNTYKTVTESSYSGIESHEWPSSSTKQVYGSPKLQKDIKKMMDCGVPEKTCNQTKWAVKVWTEWVTTVVETRNSYLTKHCLVVRLKG